MSIDVAANKMTIGGGVIFRDVYEPLYSAGKEIRTSSMLLLQPFSSHKIEGSPKIKPYLTDNPETGSCSCVGMLGATLGAGVGRYQGLHGLIIDALESVQIVTATGDLVTASKTQETDLFWAIRGAGFNFGIVVEATYTIYDLTNDGSVLNADFKFPPSANGTYFEILNSFIDTQPPELSLYTIISVDPVFGVSVSESRIRVTSANLSREARNQVERCLYRTRSKRTILPPAISQSAYSAKEYNTTNLERSHHISCL